MEKYRIVPTSKDSALGQDIILRETETTRLAFRPLIVNNIHDEQASVKGSFIFQRKAPGKAWTDHKELDLSRLKAEEWVKLELKASELRKLVLQVISLYRLHKSAGIPHRETQLIRAEVHLERLLQLDDERLTRLLDLHQTAGFDAFTRLLDWTLRAGNLPELIERLEALDPTRLRRLNQAVSITTLKTTLEIWDENETNGDEEFWQQTLSQSTFVLSQIFSSPIVVIAGKAYVGGKSIKNTGGNLLDILAANRLTGNAVLIELKTPVTRLLGHQYRDDIFNVSEEISGAVLQVANYKHQLLTDYTSLNTESEEKFEAFNPQCMVVAGNIGQEVDSKRKVKSFELFRNGLKDVHVLGYNELFEKVRTLVDLLEGR